MESAADVLDLGDRHETSPDAPQETAATDPAPPTSAVPAGLQDLVSRAQAGDATVLPQIRDYLDSHPQVWQQVGDLGTNTLNIWMGLIAGKNTLVKESLARTVESMRADLGGPHPSLLEELLVKRIISEWLQGEYADSMLAQVVDQPPKIIQFWTDRQTQTQRRHLAAIKAFTDLRRLQSQYPILSPRLPQQGAGLTAGKPGGSTEAGESTAGTPDASGEVKLGQPLSVFPPAADGPTCDPS